MARMLLGGKVPQSQTFSSATVSTANWVCPAGVYYVSLSGTGGSGIADVWAATQHRTTVNYTVGFVNGGTTVYRNAPYNYAQTQHAALESSSADRTITWSYRVYEIDVANQTMVNDYQISKRVRGLPSYAETSLTGAFTYANGDQDVVNLFDIETFFPGSYGGDTVAFGRTFAGATGGTPPTTTYNNVPVVPGNTYLIDFTSTFNGGATLTVSYYV